MRLPGRKFRILELLERFFRPVMLTLERFGLPIERFLLFALRGIGLLLERIDSFLNLR